MAAESDALSALRNITNRNLPPVSQQVELPSPQGARPCDDTGRNSHGDRISGASAGSAGRTTASSMQPPRLRYLGSCNRLTGSNGDSGDEGEGSAGYRCTFDCIPTPELRDSPRDLAEGQASDMDSADEKHDEEDMDSDQSDCEEGEEDDDQMMNRVDCCEDLSPYLDQIDLGAHSEQDFEEPPLRLSFTEDVDRLHPDRYSFLCDVPDLADQPVHRGRRLQPRRPPGPPPSRPVPPHRRNLPEIISGIAAPARMPLEPAPIRRGP